MIEVLAVDDEEFNLDLINFAFEEHPEVNVHCARDGKEALAILSKESVDVILLDLAMPVMNGFEVIAHLSEQDNTIPVIVVTANNEEKNRALEMGANDFLSKPYEPQELVLRTFNYAKINTFQKELKAHNENLEAEVKRRTQKIEETLKLAKAAEYEISQRLGRASEFRDLETGMHIKRMSHFSAKLAELAGLNSAEVELVLYASPLHDIGKVGIPDKILLKPGRFEAGEFEIMKKHAEIGALMLESTNDLPVLKAGRIIALQHHEKVDGTGYPQGLKGEEIHIYGRIVAIADVFDALTSERVYKKAFPLEKALAIMNEGKGTHFDAQLLELFFENLDTFLEIQKQFPDEKVAPHILDLMGERT